jgi:hypothetical protein
MNETLSPGKYYLGDPTLVLHDKIIIGIWGSLYNYANDKYNINGVECVMHTTHKGDDNYVDTKNRKYIVTSGVLSLINVDLIEDINLCKNNGHIFEFKQQINFIYDAGLFYIKSGKKMIKIDTRNMEEYDSDYEEHCEDEEGEHISKTINNNEDNSDNEDTCSDTNEINSINNSDSDKECSDNEENKVENVENVDNLDNEENKEVFNFFKKKS